MRGIILIVLFGWYGTVQATEKVDFGKDIWPILESRCIQCHKAPYKNKRGRTKKPKAGLRLDSPEHIMKGSKEGAVVVPGKPEESSLYTLVILPADDLDIMPQEGDPLTKEQTELIKNWIEQGAKFGPPPSEGPATPEVPTTPKAANDEHSTDLLEQLAKDVPPASDDALMALKDLGAVIKRIDPAPKKNLLCIDLSPKANQIRDQHLAKLKRLAPQVTSLNLAGTKISNSGLEHISALRKLTCLHLGKTDISDAGLAHLRNLSHLRTLNLHHTHVTDHALEHLTKIKSLNRLYVSRTKMTASGMNDLKAALPKLNIEIDEAHATHFDDKWCAAAQQKDPASKDKRHQTGDAMNHVCAAR